MPKKVIQKRRVQERALETRSSIIDAALIEFAKKGFDGASTRRIAEEAGVHQQLIIYHFKTKEILWKEVARHFLSSLQKLRHEVAESWRGLSAGDRVKREFKLIFSFVVQHPDIHRFMLQASLSDSPRLDWLSKSVSKPAMDYLVPFILEAQATGEMEQGDLTAIYYLILSSVLSLAAFSEEMKRTADIAVIDQKLVDAFWSVIERSYWRRPEPTEPV